MEVAQHNRLTTSAFPRTVAPFPPRSKRRRHGDVGAARGLALPGILGEEPGGRAPHAHDALSWNHLQALHWRLVLPTLIAHPSSTLPPHPARPFHVLFSPSLERSVRLSHFASWGKHGLCVAHAPSGRACLVFDGMSVRVGRVDTVFWCNHIAAPNLVLLLFVWEAGLTECSLRSWFLVANTEIKLWDFRVLQFEFEMCGSTSIEFLLLGYRLVHLNYK
jgi:hypothetical protein